MDIRNLLLQTDPLLTPVIRRWGCNLRCLQAIAEIEAGRALTAAEIGGLYEEGLSQKAIGPNCYINDNNAVIAAAARLLGLKKWPQAAQSGGIYLRLCHQTDYGSHFTLIHGHKGHYNPDPSLISRAITGIRYYG
jgi:hypothetical protein